VDGIAVTVVDQIVKVLSIVVIDVQYSAVTEPPSTVP
jgi:hypothetical protein